MSRLDDNQWAEIRRVWEYDPAEPTYAEAAAKAAAKFGFVAPSKQRVGERAKKEGWERRASLTGINAAAQRKADRMGVSADGPDAGADGGEDASGAKKGAADPAAAASARSEAEDLRAEVLVRHRKEALQIVALRQEALARRPQLVNGKLPAGQMDKVKEAFEAMKLTKITAEATLIQQTMERKAWGLDIVVDPEQLQQMSDDDLKALAAGKSPGRR